MFWSKQNGVLGAGFKNVAAWVGARDLCGGTVEGFRRLSFSSQIPRQGEWVCGKWEFWGIKVGRFWSRELRMVCYHSTSTPPVFPIQSMMWQQGHTHWSPTPEIGQLLPGSVSPLLAELMCTGVTQMMFIWRDFCSRVTSSLVLEYKAAWSGSSCSGRMSVELHRSFRQIRNAGLDLQHGSEIIYTTIVK